MPTLYGALLAGTEESITEKVQIIEQIGAQCARTSIELSTYHDQPLRYIDLLNQAGIPVLLNINWKKVYSEGDIKIPNDFLGKDDIPLYRERIEAVLQQYKPALAVIENEPLTKVFYNINGIDNYLDYMLPNAIEVCHKYGVKVADGALHAVIIDFIERGGRLFKKAQLTKRCIDVYATLDLDYCNVHTKAVGYEYPRNQLERVADYLRDHTRHPVTCNEYHLESDEETLLDSIWKQFKEGDYVHAIYYSSGKDNIPLNNELLELTDMGETFKSLIWK